MRSEQVDIECWALGAVSEMARIIDAMQTNQIASSTTFALCALPAVDLNPLNGWMHLREQIFGSVFFWCAQLFS